MSELMIQDKEPVKVVLLGLDLGQFDATAAWKS